MSEKLLDCLRIPSCIEDTLAGRVSSLMHSFATGDARRYRAGTLKAADELIQDAVAVGLYM